MVQSKKSLMSISFLLVLICIVLDVVSGQAKQARSVVSEKVRHEDRTIPEVDVWDTGNVEEISSFLGCEEPREDSSILHSDDTWRFFRKTYAKSVEPETNSLPPGDGTDGFEVKYSVRRNHRGRAIFAEQFISQGDVIWRSAYTARFQKGSEYRQFLHALPRHLACDILLWAYTRRNESGKAEICVDLDPGSFINGCDYEKECNLVPGRHIGRYTGCHLELVAGRDIPSGEEILLDYVFSEGVGGWAQLGLSDNHEAREGIDDYYEKSSEMFQSD